MKTIRFGLIGAGLMAKEFASAAARWCHLTTELPKPEIVGVCKSRPTGLEWFQKNFPDIKYYTTDYMELLNAPDIDAIYVAVPHDLHEEIYTAVIRSGKALLGEKPFGIDKAANDAILKAIDENPGAFVRCTSEFPYYPAVQTMIKWYNEGRFGKIINVNAGFEHSSDMDLKKPINWKRMVKTNGEYGCLGDLGIHTMHVPFKLGFIPKRVYAVMSNIVTERQDKSGNIAPCDTYDNAILMTTSVDKDGNEFPMQLNTRRIAPGATNRWYLEIYGLDCSAKFSTDDPNAFCYTASWGKEQAWSRINIGYKPMIPTITGSIFEFGFVDAMQQMIAAFVMEYMGQEVPFGLFTAEETRLAHSLQTAAVKSHKNQTVEIVE